MPIRIAPGTDIQYHLVIFDENGNERAEPDGTLMSDVVRRRAAEAPPITDVFFMSHGWQGDIPAAIEQYDRWIGAMAQSEPDRAAARARQPGFAPLVVGLHWPSLPWGDENIATTPGVLSAGDRELAKPIDVLVDAYAARIADSPQARRAIRTILDAARRNPDATTLSPSLRVAYDTLFAESGLGKGDASGRPGDDQDGFDPAAIIADAQHADTARSKPGTPGVLGIGDRIRDALVMPLRQLSFWKMKDRARTFGETGAHALLVSLQTAAPHAHFHLMGHSFGCIVVSATVAGAPGGTPLPRPVDSLFLVQGALSIWSYAADIPHSRGKAGYFHRIVKDRLVRGPIVTTHSSFDSAVGKFYPLGAQLRKQLVLADDKYPKYGGIGTHGIQGTAMAAAMPMRPATFAYNFQEGRVYNLDASAVIRHGAGASGAHSDIAHPEVAHAFWSAVLFRDSKFGSAPPHPPLAVNSAASSEGRPKNPGLLGRVMRAMRPTRSGTRGMKPKAASTPGHRWINAELDDHHPDEPLMVGDWYTLAFDIDVAARDTAVGAAALDDSQLFPEATEEVELTVQLDSDDFEITDRTRPLRVPRSGRSRGKARFDMAPRHDGASTVKATIHKAGNFIQQMELTFEVGASPAAAVRVSAKGRPAGAANIVQPRDLGLSIAPAAGGGYDCVVWGSVSSRARLTIQQAHLASAIEAVRQELMKVVMYQDAAGAYIFQTSVDIATVDRDVALRTMARAGALLFQKIFYGPAAGADSKAVGDYLRTMASAPDTRLTVQIVAESTPVPWAMLYVGDASAGATLDWGSFIGMRHVIEQIPLQTTLSVSDCAIASDKPQLSVSVNTNDGIDAQMGADFVAQQHGFWRDAANKRRRVRVTPRTTRAQVIQALADGDTGDQILYFYCHAESAGLTDAGGPDSSCLVLTDARVTLGDLSLDAPTSTQLRGNPLVFINACESASMSPSFYDGFVPYFMAKGARGVVGTECQTPALFAVAWAKRFFERFLDGAPLGETFLDLRREFLEEHGNPLGLLYAVHCDGDTQIHPALTAL